MPIEVIERVSALIEESDRIERESESIYLELGRLFPSLSAEMERGADSSERSFRALESFGGDGRLGREGRGETLAGSSFVHEASAFFAALNERDSSLLDRINDGIQRLGSLEQIIARVRADSEEMEIISLNAMTVALKSGAEGKGFSVITDELKRLSGHTIALTEGVTASGRSLLGFFDKLRGALSELDGFQKEFFSSIDATLSTGLAEIEGGLSAATTLFSSLLSEARSVRDPVIRVMGGIQLQDIVRQSLQHVSLSLKEARDAVGSGASGADVDQEPAAFVAAVAELTESLIADIVDKLDSNASAFGTDMRAVSDIVGESERRRLEFLEKSAYRSAGSDSMDFRQRSERYLGLKRSVVTMASKLAEHVSGLDASFKGLSGILSRFQNIVVASRIEVAKTKALAGVITTVSGMITLTDRIESDVSAAMDTTKDFKRLTSSALGGYSDEAGGERLVSTLGRVEEDMGRLSDAKDSLQRAIESFSLYTEDFIGLIGRAGEELGKLNGLSERLRSAGQSLGELKSSLRESLSQEISAVESERLRSMVERFTIFTHKKAAGDIGRFQVEEGSEAGEVTLF